MTNARYRFAHAKCIAKLPDVDRRLYKFIKNKEKELANLAKTPDDYSKLLKRHSPLHEASVSFGLRQEDVVETVEIIEKYIEPLILEKMDKMKFTEYEFHESPSAHGKKASNTKYFLFTDE